MYKQLIENRKKDFEKAIEHLHTELSGVRTGRANPALVENLLIESYGATSPLKNIASITVPDAKSLLIQPWDKGLLSAVEKAIQASNVGIQPVNDGLHIRLTLPPLSQERRVELAKVIKQQAESARVRLRSIREEIWKEVTAQVKDKKFTEDQKYEAQDELKKLMDDYNEQVKTIAEKKETEIMTI